MNVEETIEYLREKGDRYLLQGNSWDDEHLIDKGLAYLEIARELEERVTS